MVDETLVNDLGGSLWRNNAERYNFILKESLVPAESR